MASQSGSIPAPAPIPNTDRVVFTGNNTLPSGAPPSGVDTYILNNGYRYHWSGSSWGMETPDRVSIDTTNATPTSAPSPNTDTHISPNGTIYHWNGSAWVMYAKDRVIIGTSNTPPSATPDANIDTHVMLDGTVYYWSGSAWITRSPDRVVISETNTVPIAAPPHGVDTHVLLNGTTYYWTGSAWVAASSSSSPLNVLTTAQTAPTPTGNTTNLNTVFKDATGKVWAVDQGGDSMLLEGAEEIIDVSGATLPITFPVTTIPGTPVFEPATPATVGYVYAITNGTTVVYAKWNGTQYISSPAPATTNVLSNAANAITSTVNGIASTIAPSLGTIATTVGFNAAGVLVRQAVKAFRSGRVQGGDVGAGSSATATGDFSGATKNSPGGSNRSDFSVTFSVPMPTSLYVVLITPSSQGTLTNDNEIRVPILVSSSLTTTGFTFSVREIASITQQDEYHILVREI